MDNFDETNRAFERQQREQDEERLARTMSSPTKLETYSKKHKAMERLIFLVRTKRDAESSNDYMKKEIKMGFEDTAEELDSLGIPMWKQNYISMMAQESNMYAVDIINYVYYLKKPTDYKRKY